MRKNIRIKQLLLLSTILAVLAGCVKKDDFYKENSADSGAKTVVKIIDAPGVLRVRDLNPTIDTFLLLEVRRDAASSADLNQTLTVKLTKADTLVTNAGYTVLPSNAYTLLTDVNNLTFKPGEFAKEILIKVDKSKFDLTKQYAIGYVITDAGSGAVASGDNKKILINVILKNKYDGKYQLDGAFYHPTSSPNYDPFTIDVELHTSGPNSVKLYVPDFGGYYGPGLFGGVLNAFGAQEPEITIDPVTNKATVQNSYSGAVTFYTMAPNYDSHYDPAAKKIYVKYGYNYAAGPTFNPATNREWTYVFTYLGPR